jgi:uncharacterized paraquat-inducible protein A
MREDTAMRYDADYKFEKFEEYYGEIEEVKKQVNHCPECDGQYRFTHLSDFKHLYVTETAKCIKCDHSVRKTVHIIN